MLAGYRESLQMITGTQRPLRLDANPQVSIQYTKEVTVVIPHTANFLFPSCSVWSEEVCIVVWSHN